MEDTDEDFYGKTIPVEFRNKLVEWRVDSPYDGCFWKMSHGVVDGDGNFHPINAEGRDLNAWMEVVKSDHGLVLGSKGLYDHSDGWYDRERDRIRAKHGFHTHEDPAVTYSRLEFEAIENVFGTKWYEVPAAERKGNPKVLELLGDWPDKLDACKAELKDLHRRRQERLNALFMGAMLDETPEEFELHSLADRDIKETCEMFCNRYKGTVAVMCGVLDALARLDYDVWCKCSDCGEMFQLSDYEKFSHLIDDNCYHGDGGIGCIFTRVVCETCRDQAECPQCHELNLPNSRDPSIAGHEYDHVNFREEFIMEWLGVCEYCADRFFYKDEYHHWEEELEELEEKIDAGKEQLKDYLATMKDQGMSEEELKRLEEENLKSLSEQWRELKNEMRDKMEDDAYEFFTDANDWTENRL